jgi:hypothetical protein
MIAVITGGRDVYPNMSYVEETLSVLKQDGVFPEDLLIRNGNCPTGVDLMVMLFCIANRIQYTLHPAMWHIHGNSAGPMRNRDMMPGADICIVFPGGAGTRNCRSAAKSCGVPVHLSTTPGVLAANRRLTK